MQDAQRDPFTESVRTAMDQRFQVVEPGAETTAGNQVTADQLASLTEMLVDIGRGDSDLRFDTADMDEAQARIFRSGALTDIADILQTESGRALVQSLHEAPRHGFLGLGGDRDTFIGQHGGATGDSSNALGGGDQGKRGMVQYVPRADHGPNGELRSDVTLYHELVHAHHAIYDSWDHDPVVSERGGSDIDVANGVSESEHQAVGLGEHANARFSENRYRAERRQIGASGYGAREGDRSMPHRSDYLGFTHDH